MIDRVSPIELSSQDKSSDTKATYKQGQYSTMQNYNDPKHPSFSPHQSILTFIRSGKQGESKDDDYHQT